LGLVGLVGVEGGGWGGVVGGGGGIEEAIDVDILPLRVVPRVP